MVSQSWSSCKKMCQVLMLKDRRSELSESICLAITVTLAYVSLQWLLMIDRMGKCAWSCWKIYLKAMAKGVDLNSLACSCAICRVAAPRDIIWLVASKWGPSCCFYDFMPGQLSWHVLLQEISPTAFLAWLNLAMGTFPHCTGCIEHWWHVKTHCSCWSLENSRTGNLGHGIFLCVFLMVQDQWKW